MPNMSSHQQPWIFNLHGLWPDISERIGEAHGLRLSGKGELRLSIWQKEELEQEVMLGKAIEAHSSAQKNPRQEVPDEISVSTRALQPSLQGRTISHRKSSPVIFRRTQLVASNKLSGRSESSFHYRVLASLWTALEVLIILWKWTYWCVTYVVEAGHYYTDDNHRHSFLLKTTFTKRLFTPLNNRVLTEPYPSQHRINPFGSRFKLQLLFLINVDRGINQGYQLKLLRFSNTLL